MVDIKEQTPLRADKSPSRGSAYFRILLFREFCVDKLAVEAGDVAQRNVLGAFGGACTGVGAVAETELVHFAHHSAGTAATLNLTLGQECELAHLGRHEEHGRTVLAGSHAGAATDACGGVHGHIGHFLADGQAIGILGATAVERNITAGLLDFVEGVAVDCEVADYGERSRAPGLDGDQVAIVEFAHVKLASGNALHGAVGMTVDVQRAHAADTFTAVVVEYYGFFALFDQLLVEHVEHFQERASGGNVVERIVDELSFLFRTTLTPNFQFYADILFHFC